MAKRYSQDLRDRVIDGEDGQDEPTGGGASLRGQRARESLSDMAAIAPPS